MIFIQSYSNNKGILAHIYRQGNAYFAEVRGPKFLYLGTAFNLGEGFPSLEGIKSWLNEMDIETFQNLVKSQPRGTFKE